MDLVTLFGGLVLLAAAPIFWVALVFTLMILWALVVNERGGFATLVTIVFGVLLAAKFPAVIAFVTDPILMIVTVIAYAVIGVLWSRYKWSNFLTKKAEAFVARRESFLKDNNLPLDYFKAHPYDLIVLGKFVTNIKSTFARGSYQGQDLTLMQDVLKLVAPAASANKGSIVMWIAYWPISVIWFIIADLVTELAEAIYRAVGGHFQKMSDAKFAAISSQ